MRIKSILYSSIWILTLVSMLALESCQSDARNSTRIPPVIKKSKAQWEKDALLSLSDLISRSIDLDVNYFKRARIYFDQEQYRPALEDINEAIDEQENVGEYFLLRGKVYRELGELDKGLEDAERAEALQQGSPELYVLLADLLQAKGRFREASRYLSHAMKLAPYDASAYYVKGMLEARQGDSLASLSSLNYAMVNNPRMLRAYIQSTIINRRLNNFGQAIVINNRAIQRFKNIPELYYERGEIYNVLAKPDTAVIYYQMAFKVNPNYTEAIIKLANIELYRGHYYQALVAFQQLQKTSPQYPGINNLLGFCYEKLGDYTKAREYYTVALTMNPDDRPAHNGMWRMRRNEMAGSQFPSEEGNGDEYRSLDSARVKINMIQPRKTINMQVDSSRKAKIQ
ncbi:tetratricopeptide repeat protein [Dyadobacter psychrotolerans]|uniref:Tetratricopeptide repeat protein n=1 Tax=Dyadobacter psychrotolerans TaxID=2541721 RepID=A0A4R5DXW2_9BACT|nr:tetratricopeptide repeat protein [Dyadobacter psychrotolerans]TDE17534.1 tetratricopeptide repeat protein [Dyadobacter psychrotolerans]